MCPREKGFVLWGHCQNLFDDPRKKELFFTRWGNRKGMKQNTCYFLSLKTVTLNMQVFDNRITDHYKKI